MLSRQESSLSSSSRRQVPATPPPPSQTHQPKSIGCMSGIIHLFSKYQNRHKRLTSGRKQDKCKGALPLQQPQQPPTTCKDSLSVTENDKIEKQNSDHTHTASPSLSRDTHVPRSPTIPPEIRRSESPRTPPASSLVARLMGLDDVIVAKRPLLFEEADNEAVTEKRRRLLRALDKCNEDLEALKRIIDRAAVEKSPENCMKKSGGTDDDVEELSPVCVLDEFARSPTSPSPSPSPTRLNGVQNISEFQHISLQHFKLATTKRLVEDDKPTAKHILLSKYSTTTEYASLFQMRRNVMAAASSRSSKAMVKSVNEVCNDIVWGEKREIKIIGLVLQDNLCKDLVEELVHDLKSCCMDYPLPFEGCKRRLCF